MKGWSAKPCPGCGVPGHPIDAVCSRCRATLDAAQARARRLAAQHPALRTYRLPLDPDCYHMPSQLPRPAETALQRAVAAALLALSDRPEFRDTPFPRPEHDEPWHGSLLPGPWNRDAVSIPLTFDQATAVRALLPAIAAALHEAYQRGLAKGSDLLGQLASGTIPVALFEERSGRKP